MARPDPHGSLADGVLIQGSVRGRVFGIPILKIDTTLVLSPAQIHDSVMRVGPPSTPELPRTSTTDGPNARRLADAVKAIGEGEAQLAHSRQAGK